MKIGLLTFHNTINYGGVLQCYALKEVIESIGHKVEIIDYRARPVEEYKSLYVSDLLFSRNGILKKLRYLFGSILIYPRKKRAVENFNKFLSSRFEFSKRVFTIQDIPHYYDFIIFGSDQIWSPELCKGLDPVYWGQFEKAKTRFVTYATSLGEPSSIDEKQWNLISQYITVFDNISVREQSLKNELVNRFGVHVKCCIDPTLLCDSSIFEHILIRPNIENYVFLYNVLVDDNAINFAYNLASQLGCKLVVGRARPKRFKNDKRYTSIEGITPEVFLGYIKNARVIVGNSFHVIALSLSLEKDFYSLNSLKSGRIRSILNQLDLLERHVSSYDVIDKLNNVDYSIVREKLKTLRNESFEYIKSSIG